MKNEKETEMKLLSKLTAIRKQINNLELMYAQKLRSKRVKQEHTFSTRKNKAVI